MDNALTGIIREGDSVQSSQGGSWTNWIIEKIEELFGLVAGLRRDKVDKPEDVTRGHIAVFEEDGNIKDGGSIDTTPTLDSPHPISSGAVFNGLGRLNELKADKDAGQIFNNKGRIAITKDGDAGGEIVVDFATEDPESEYRIPLSYDDLRYTFSRAGAIYEDDEGTVTGGAIYDALSDKIDKVTGKGLSTNDFTDAYKTKLDGIESGAQANILDTVKINGTTISPVNKGVDISIKVDGTSLTPVSGGVNIDLSGKVDKITGKGLSTNDYTTAEKNKLAGIDLTYYARIEELQKYTPIPCDVKNRRELYIPIKRDSEYYEWFNIIKVEDDWPLLTDYLNRIIKLVPISEEVEGRTILRYSYCLISGFISLEQVDKLVGFYEGLISWSLDRSGEQDVMHITILCGAYKLEGKAAVIFSDGVIIKSMPMPEYEQYPRRLSKNSRTQFI